MDIDELRKKVNIDSIQVQVSDYNQIFHRLNPKVKIFSPLPPVDELSKEDEDHYRNGILEANQLRKEGLL